MEACTKPVDGGGNTLRLWGHVKPFVPDYEGEEQVPDQIEK